MDNKEIDNPYELIETLRNWEDMFFSESETKLVMNQAADLIEKLLPGQGNASDILYKLGDEHLNLFSSDQTD